MCFLLQVCMNSLHLGQLHKNTRELRYIKSKIDDRYDGWKPSESLLIAGDTSVLGVLSDYLILNWQNPKREATQNLAISPANPTISLSNTEEEQGLHRKSAALWSMTKVLDGERGAFHITQAVRSSKRVQKGVRLDMTGAFGANRPETLPYVSHAADISLSSQMASQIAGISRLISFCFSFFSTAII